VDEGAARRSGVLARLRTATTGGPLGNRSFLLLSGGQLASTIGDLCYAVALPWLVLSNHGGTVLLGTVLACYGMHPLLSSRSGTSAPPPPQVQETPPAPAPLRHRNRQPHPLRG
jgi:hypothetical protein